MHIGEAAQQTGLTVDAIRFYERRGLLPRALRTEGGFRLYGERDVGSLRFIRQMQALGFSLEEVRELLALRSQEHACTHVRELLAAKLSAVHGKIAELRRLEHDLTGALRRCHRQVRSSRKRPHDCPVLEQVRGKNVKPA